MKEASGELTMTLIVIVAAGAVLLIFYAFRDPIYQMINRMWGNFESKSDNTWTPGQGGYIITEGYSYIINE